MDLKKNTFYTLNDVLAEITSSSLSTILARTKKEISPLPFGSLSLIPYEKYEVIGCIVSIQIVSEEKGTILPFFEEAEILKKKHPELLLYHHTQLTIFLLGHIHQGTFHSGFPPVPPPLHTHCYPFSLKNIPKCFSFPELFSGLYQHRSLLSLPLEEFLIAFVRWGLQEKLINYTDIQILADQYALLAGTSYQTMQYLFRRLDMLF